MASAPIAPDNATGDGAAPYMPVVAVVGCALLAALVIAWVRRARRRQLYRNVHQLQEGPGSGAAHNSIELVQAIPIGDDVQVDGDAIPDHGGRSTTRPP